jgi:predicted outer membrane protein
MISAKRHLALVVSAAILVCGGWTAGFAESAGAPNVPLSPVSAAFLANLHENLNVLDRIDRLAVAHGTGDKLRAFARAGDAEHLQVAQAFGALEDEAAVETGRSVAVDGSDAQKAPAANGRPLPGHAEIERLASVSGRAFDDLYWQEQLESLSQIESDYRAYIEVGDDPALVEMARRELPTIMRRLEALSRI